MGQSRPLFCLFSFFSRYNFNTNWKKCRWYAWDSNPGPQDGRRIRNLYFLTRSHSFDLIISIELISLIRLYTWIRIRVSRSTSRWLNFFLFDQSLHLLLLDNSPVSQNWLSLSLSLSLSLPLSRFLLILAILTVIARIKGSKVENDLKPIERRQLRQKQKSKQSSSTFFNWNRPESKSWLTLGRERERKNRVPFINEDLLNEHAAATSSI